MERASFLFLLFIGTGIVTFVDWLVIHSWNLVCLFPYVHLDKLLHILGGATVAFCFLWLFETCRSIFHPGRIHKNYFLIVAVLSALVVGILWEVLQHFVPWFTQCGIAPHQFLNADTIVDIIADVFGGYLAYVIVQIKTKDRA